MKKNYPVCDKCFEKRQSNGIQEITYCKHNKVGMVWESSGMWTAFGNVSEEEFCCGVHKAFLIQQGLAQLQQPKQKERWQ